MERKNHVLNYLPEEFLEVMLESGEKKFRVNQIYDWISNKNTIDFSQMLNLSLALRKKLGERFSFDLPTILNKAVSIDGTTKYLLELFDGNTIEMVLMPGDKKNTLCISSQVGCSRNCQFCATATLGLVRNLEVHEILAQVLIARAESGEKRVSNLVYMGMGEPLDNLDNVIKATKFMQHEQGFSMSPRKMTISTSGVTPKIKALADSNLKIKLAVSLNSAVPAKREILMPITKQYPLDELKKELIKFRKISSFRLTFEYVLIQDFNMGKDDLKALRKFLGDISCKLNLIKWNEVEGLDYSSPSDNEIDEFNSALQNMGIAVTQRKSRGQDIDAACGQLAAKYSVNRK